MWETCRWHAESAVYIICTLLKGQLYSYTLGFTIEMFFSRIDARSDLDSQGGFFRGGSHFGRYKFVPGIDFRMDFSFNQFSLTSVNRTARTNF